MVSSQPADAALVPPILMGRGADLVELDCFALPSVATTPALIRTSGGDPPSSAAAAAGATGAPNGSPLNVSDAQLPCADECRVLFSEPSSLWRR